VLPGAVVGQTAGAQTTPALGTSATLTAASSTAAFTSTNGTLIVGNNIIATYASLSGSTFVTVYFSQAGVVIPPGSPIQQAGNTAAYQAIAVIGQISSTGILRPDYNLAGSTLSTSTVNLAAVPAAYGPQLNTVVPATGSAPATYGSVNPVFFALRIHASPTTPTTFTTQQFVGSISYYLKGYTP
jgi:hypothetical protein